MAREVRVLSDAGALARAACEHIVAAATAAIAERGSFSLALAGGSTPLAAYALLARAGGIDWAATHLFWSDERCVPPDDPASNYRGASETLLRRVTVAHEGVHRIRGELSAPAAAAEYDALLAAFFQAPSPARLVAEGRAAMDLVLLGVGADGHTASLFAGSPALEANGWAVAAAARAESALRERVTLTLPAIGAARAALLIASGAEKRAAVAICLAAAQDDASAPPAARVRALGSTLWLLDADAAGRDRQPVP